MRSARGESSQAGPRVQPPGTRPRATGSARQKRRGRVGAAARPPGAGRPPGPHGARAPASQPGPRASAPRADPVAPLVGVVPRDAGGMAREPAVTLPVQTDGAFPRVDVGCQIRLHAPSTQTDVRGDGSCPDPPSSSSGSTDRCSREIGFSCTLQFLAEMSKIKHL